LKRDLIINQMPELPPDDRQPGLELMGSPAGLSTAVRHALAWWVVGNSVGFYLALLLLRPAWQFGELTYGRWVPVHLNVQLYGWTSLPLVAWLISIYEVDRSRIAAWGPVAVWGWTGALTMGVFHWLAGATSGKIFLDWKGGALWALLVALMFLWCVLMAAWQERSAGWSTSRKRSTLAGLLGLALVPASLAFAAAPAVYPPIDRTTGGPTGSSLLGSTLIVVGLMLLLPRLVAGTRSGRKNRAIWLFFGVSWLVFGVMEAIGGTHHDAHQIGSLVMLLPWVWWLPRDWAGVSWPHGSRVWRGAVFGWWGVLVVSGLLMYQPGVLDRLKFTQGLVAHSHLAFAGFTTSFCALLLVLLTGRRMGGTASVVAWHLAVLVMIMTLAVMGWREGAGPSWMNAQPMWRELGFVIRAHCGALMLAVSVLWWWERRTL
jgi:cytochrome c oxidase cbb3-type subunit 1